MADDAFTELALRYLDGLVSQEEFLRLTQELGADAAKRQAFVQLCLQVQAIGETVQQAAPDQATAPPRSSRRRWLGGGMAGAAAVLLVLALAWWWRPVSTTVLARVIEVDGTAEVVSDGTAAPASVGQELFAGQALRTVGADSTVALEYLDRTRLELSAETHVQFDAASAGKIVRLREGRLAAEVTPQPDGQPLELHTAQFVVVVRATRFSARSTARETRIAVEEGAVDVKRATDATATLVDAGNEALATADGPVVVRSLGPLALRPAGEIKIGWVWGALTFDPVRNTLITEEKGVIAERDPQTLRMRSSFDAGETPLRHLAVAEAGTLAASSGGQPTLWNRNTGQLLRKLDTGRDGLIALALAPDGQRVAASFKRTKTQPDSLLIWSAGGDLLHRLTPESGGAQAVAFSPDGRLLVAGTEHGGLSVWESATGKLVRTLTLLNQQRAAVDALAFSPDGRWLAAGGAGRIVRLWDSDTWQPGLELTGLEAGVGSLAFAPRHPWLAVGGADGWVRLFHRADGHELAQLRVAPRVVRVISFSPDGGMLATSGVMYRVKLWTIVGP